MKVSKYILCIGDDWEGLYKLEDGAEYFLCDEGHEIHLLDYAVRNPLFLKEVIYVDNEWLTRFGNFPYQLKDVVRAR